MAPIRVKSFNVEERGGRRRRAEQTANSAPVFVVKTSYVDCGKGRKDGTNEREAERGGRSKVGKAAEKRRPLNDPSKGKSGGREGSGMDGRKHRWRGFSS